MHMYICRQIHTQVQKHTYTNRLKAIWTISIRSEQRSNFFPILHLSALFFHMEWPDAEKEEGAERAESSFNWRMAALCSNVFTISPPPTRPPDQPPSNKPPRSAPLKQAPNSERQYRVGFSMPGLSTPSPVTRPAHNIQGHSVICLNVQWPNIVLQCIRPNN